MTKTELREMVDRWESDPNFLANCDLLCDVCDLLPGQPEGEYSVDDIREMIDQCDLDDWRPAFRPARLFGHLTTPTGERR